MRVFSQHKSHKIDEENPYWISFSDLMSALLVVFILAVVALIIELTEIKNEIEQTQEEIEKDIAQLKNANKARKDILDEIKKELDEKGIIVFKDKNDKVLIIPEATLTFKSNSDQIPKGNKSRQIIKIIGETLHSAINKEFDPGNDPRLRLDFLDTVFIEGHTDSLPTKRYRGGNWGLSSLRAIALWEFWGSTVNLKPAFGDMVNLQGEKLFSISGYAATRRREPEEITKVQRASNRRIDIRFTVKRPKVYELENIVAR